MLQQATVVNGNRRQKANGKGNHCCAFYPLVVVISWRWWAGGKGSSSSQRVKESGPNGSS
jgi:hypothetical protein